MTNLNLDDDISKVKGVGDKFAKLLKKKDILTVKDAIRYYPRDYEDYTKIVDIEDLKEGEECCFVASASRISQVNFRNKKKPFTCVLRDDSSSIRASFFAQAYLREKLCSGDKFLFHAKIKSGSYGLEVVNPDIEDLPEAISQTDLADKSQLKPIYSLTQGLKQFMLRKMMQEIIKNYTEVLPELLPKSVCKHYGLCAGRFAYEKIHFPDSYKELEVARRRLKFEELFLIQYGLRTMNTKEKSGINLKLDQSVKDEFRRYLDILPFKLTEGQKLAIKDILKDLDSSYQMNRLVQGDVGSGKTIVAFLAMVYIYLFSRQSVLMAPTSVLAEQHYKNFLKLFPNIPSDKVALLTGKLKKKEKDKIYSSLKSGEIKFLIGTHAVLSEGVEFNNLALAITDEQHRFGVKQRIKLNTVNHEIRTLNAEEDLHKDTDLNDFSTENIDINNLVKSRDESEKKRKASDNCEFNENTQSEGKNEDSIPHILVMSATPIPRTLALILYGDLAISWINESPKGRQKVDTYTARNEKHDRQIVDIGRRQLTEGGAIFYICPTIEDDENGLHSVADTYEIVSKQYPEYKVAKLHGAMKEKEKQDIMHAFANGEIDILVSTTVVEVGVDVPRANMIVILDAERYGMAQLHQLRGRVGRGKLKSYCFLRTNLNADSLASKRLREVCVNDNGMDLANKDLELRGPGDFFGTRQHGLPDFRIANLYNDKDLLAETTEAVEKLLNNELEISEEDFKFIRRGLDFYFGQEKIVNSM